MTSPTGAAPGLAARRHWLFDMDGTLTRAMHDFDAMRETLGLPAGVPILEALDAMEPSRARVKRSALDALELDMAAEAEAQPGAVALLESLAARDASLSIVTRNGAGIARATLAACGLARFFPEGSVVSRDDDCAPKPDPAPVRLALARLSADAADAVMVGDYLFDLRAGRDAGTLTVHLDVDGAFAWPDVTDVGVGSLEELRTLLLRET